MSAPTVAVFLTKRETQVLRRLIIEEARRLGHGTYQSARDEPSKLRLLKPVAKKIWDARQHFSETEEATRGARSSG